MFEVAARGLELAEVERQVTGSLVVKQAVVQEQAAVAAQKSELVAAVSLDLVLEVIQEQVAVVSLD